MLLKGCCRGRLTRINPPRSWQDKCAVSRRDQLGGVQPAETHTAARRLELDPKFMLDSVLVAVEVVPMPRIGAIGWLASRGHHTIR